MAMLRSGDHVAAGSDIYGGTYRLLHQVTDRAGIDVTLVDTTDPANLETAITPATKLVWVESPGNPRMTITDIAACAEIAHQHGALLGRRQHVCFAGSHASARTGRGYCDALGYQVSRRAQRSHGRSLGRPRPSVV